MNTIRAATECVWPAGALLGEGPTWHAPTGSVFWCDIKGKRLHALRLSDARRQSWSLPYAICSLDTPPQTWRPPGSVNADTAWFVGCAQSGFSWFSVRGDEVIAVPIFNPEADKPGNRFNDGKMGPDGRYWAGTMDNAETAATGALYAFGEDGAAELIDAGYVVSNGPAFSPDGRTIYHTDSARRTIYAFAPDGPNGALRRQVFMRFGESEGYPDGMTTDGAGNLWVAMWDGGCLRKISPRGAQLGVLPMPVARPTSCLFVGEALFVTSAALGASPEDRLAGGLFRIDLAG